MMESTTENSEATDVPVEASQEAAEPSPPKPEKLKQTFKCLVCGKSYSKKTSLFTHHKTHPEHCVHCGLDRGSSVEQIYEHNLKHVNIRPFVCKLCGESFLRNQQFVEHEKAHDKPPEEPVVKESKYKCKACQSNFSNWKLFYKHQQESGHFNEKFLCEICGSEFLSNFLLAQHIRRLHKRTDETFPCPSCSKTFASKPNLDSHIKKIHQNDNKKHLCEICNNSFSSGPNLKQHVKTVHEVEKEYECQTCKKPFKAKNRLTRHEKEVHMGNTGNPDEGRMFNCDHCQKKYKRSWHQVRHSQMKHENSNTSTATTSSAGTPPTPEINGNAINSNYNYQQQPQQLQQVPQMPPQTLDQDMNQMTASYNQQPLVANSWNNNSLPPQPPLQQHPVYSNEMASPKIPAPVEQPQPPPVQSTGDYVNYAVNEYSNKFDQVRNAPASSNDVQQYDTWNQNPQPVYWDNNPQRYNMQPNMQPMYHQQPPPPQNDWYYDPNLQQQQHGAYNNTYSTVKSDYNCLNQPPAPLQHVASNPDPSLYGGPNYFYPQTPPIDPYMQPHPQPEMNGGYQQHIEYQHPNQFQSGYHQSSM